MQSANAKLKAALTYKSDVQGALRQLQDNLDLAGRASYKVAPARVIGRGSASTFSQTITIDKGESSGIRRNMTVISENGLVGVVKTITNSASVVLLMSDPTFRVGVRVGRNQSNAVLIGGGGSLYTVELLDPAGSIEIGDSLDSIFYGNVAIGQYVAKRAGIGINAGGIRALGSKVRNGEVVHTGVIPFFKMFQSTLHSCSQGGIRKEIGRAHV